VSRGAGARGDRGSASIELVILAPAFLLVVMLLVMAGRLAIAQQTMEQVAFESARAASLSRVSYEARSVAVGTAEHEVRAQALRCTDTPEVELNNVEAFSAPPGEASNVEVTVRCRVDMADLAIPGTPGSVTVESTQISPIDTYRGRGVGGGGAGP